MTEQHSLFAITKTQPKNISETKLMSVFVGERRDGNYGITFSLLEKRNLDLFAHFCEDMITYTKHITKNKNIFHRKGLRRIQRWLGIPRREDRSRRNSTAGGCQRDPGGTGCYGQSRRPDRYH